MESIQERLSKEIGGLTFYYPAGEEDVIDLLAPEILSWIAKRKAAASEEGRGMRNSLIKDQPAAMLLKGLSHYAGLPADASLRDAIAQRLTLCARYLANGWRASFEDFREVHLWDARELKPWQADAPKTYQFPCFFYDLDKGKIASLNHANAEAFPAMETVKLGGDRVEPFRIDYPLPNYWGMSADEVTQTINTRLLTKLDPSLIASAKKEASNLLVLAMEDAGTAQLIRQWGLVDDAQLVEEVVHAYLSLIGLQAITKDTNGYRHMRHRLGKDFFNLDSLKDQEFWEGLRPKLLAFDSAKLTASERKLTAAIWGLALAATENPKQLVNIGKALAATKEHPPTAEDWRNICMGLKDTKGIGFEVLVSKVFDRMKELILRQVAPKNADSVEIEDKTLAANDPRRPSDPLPPTVAAQRNSSNFGGFEVSYPIILEDAVQTLGEELTRHHVARAEWLSKQSVQRDEEMIPALREWFMKRTGIAMSDAISDGLAGMQIMAREVNAESIRMHTWPLEIWFKEELKSLLRGGKHHQFVTYDAATDMASLSIEHSNTARADASGEPRFPLPINSVDPGSSVKALREHVRNALGSWLEAPDEAAILSHEAQLFVTVHEYIEAMIISKVITSQDRRWFCDGMANYLALLFCRDYLGEEEANRAFDSLYDDETCRANADQVDLTAWPTAEAISSGNKPEPPEQHAHYYFATRVIERACQDRGDAFIQWWFRDIRKTYERRRTMGTIASTYQGIANTSLVDLIDDVVTDKPAAKLGETQP